MTLIEHIEKYLAELRMQIIHGEGHGKGNLPGLILKGLKEKEKVLKEALKVLSRNAENIK